MEELRPGSSSSDISITIKSVGAECCQLRVALDLSVRDLKQAVAAQMDVPVERQRLIYGGQVLKDDRPLRHYKLENDVVVHLVARPEGATANAANDDSPAAEESLEISRNRATTGFGHPGMVMGTVTIPEGQGLDLATIMNSMLGGIGQTLASTPQARSGPAAHAEAHADEELPGWAHVRQCEAILEARALYAYRHIYVYP